MSPEGKIDYVVRNTACVIRIGKYFLKHVTTSILNKVMK